MSSVRFASLVVLIAILTGLAGGCEEPRTADVSTTADGALRLGSVEAVDTLMRAVAPSGRPLIIEGFRGSVRLRGEDRSTAQFRFVRRGRGSNAEAAREALGEVTVTESGTQKAYTYTLETDGGAYAMVDVRGTVPTATVLRVKQSSGPVTLAGINGPLTVKHEHGSVTIRGAADSVDVEIRNGDVAVHFAALPADAVVSLRTANGDVTVGLPPGASAQIDAQTDAGRIRSQALSLTEQHFAPRNAGGQYSAQLGTGAVPVDLRTKNGTIRIAAADTMPAAPATPPPSVPSQAPSEEKVPPVPPSDTTVLPEESLDTTAPAPMSPDTAAGDTVAP